MPSITPEVDKAAEILEISNDFGEPKELLREAISNSFDAGACEIKISVFIDKSKGRDQLVIEAIDDGEGMDLVKLNEFFSLGFSSRRKLDSLGNKQVGPIGEKGHGTKIYYNSERIEVETVSNNKKIVAYMDEPKTMLRQHKVPIVNYEETAENGKNYTKITVRGYNDNTQAGFSHNELKDYIYWFTKFGSFEKEVGMETYSDRILLLRGLGWDSKETEKLTFGHPFPNENVEIQKLKEKDPVAPLDYYVARWIFPREAVGGMPNINIDIAFYIEGDSAKREYNKMLHKTWERWQDGQYTVTERYGLWLCKDFMPITRENAWVTEKGTEYTKYHAFVNCQEFKLTANRGDIGNTPKPVMDAVRETVERIFQSKIKQDPNFIKYRNELDKQEQVRNAQEEEKDLKRRRELTLRKKVATYKNIELYEPRQESGVFSIVLQLLTLQSDIFGFKLLDYDTSIGYDLLVTKDTELNIERVQLAFVEMKYQLQRDFNHSFKRLDSIICWDTNLANGDEVIDLAGEKRKIVITAAPKGVDKAYTKYMLVSTTEAHNIEVFVLKEFLEERLGIKFKPRKTE